MNDCIERKKAIELIQPHVKPQTVYGKGYLQAIEHATDILELMPAADVQPIVYAHKTINVGRRSYCSNCGKLAIMEDFCSKCGAKVKDGDANG